MSHWHQALPSLAALLLACGAWATGAQCVSSSARQGRPDASEAHVRVLAAGASWVDEVAMSVLRRKRGGAASWRTGHVRAALTLTHATLASACAWASLLLVRGAWATGAQRVSSSACPGRPDASATHVRVLAAAGACREKEGCCMCPEWGRPGGGRDQAAVRPNRSAKWPASAANMLTEPLASAAPWRHCCLRALRGPLARSA